MKLSYIDIAFLQLIAKGKACMGGISPSKELYEGLNFILVNKSHVENFIIYLN
jgi:hypothetical protein